MDPSGAYTLYGDPTRPSIIFLHGIRLGREIWGPHARALAHDYHVITLDLPGHGALAGVPFTSDNLNDLLDAVIAQFTSSPPLVVGYSLGGYATMQYASDHPDRTRALLLSGCTLDFESWKRWPYELSVRLSDAIPEMMLAPILKVSMRLTLPKRFAEIASLIPYNREVVSQTYAIARAERRFSEKLVGYHKPVLFVNGEFDLIFRLDERRFLRCVPQARLRILRGVNHTAPLRRVEEFTSTVRVFAQKVFGR
jgi:pimeloyl-ACP methyl ester carboxylesterase